MNALYMIAASLVTSLLLSPPMAKAAAACQPPFYRMMCRGKIKQEYFTAVVGEQKASFRLLPGWHMPTGAGEDGRNLLAGTCAFVDRPTRPGEPDAILFVLDGAIEYGAANLMFSCLPDRDCALEFCVRSEGSHFRADARMIDLNYPTFIR